MTSALKRVFPRRQGPKINPCFPPEFVQNPHDDETKGNFTSELIHLQKMKKSHLDKSVLYKAVIPNHWAATH